VTSGRDWYPVIFAELERTGATEAGIGVREVEDDEPGIWIEFFAPSFEGLWVCELEEAPLFLDSISEGEASDPSDFGQCFNGYFDDSDLDDGDEEGA
jgi:hypothetical protein